MYSDFIKNELGQFLNIKCPFCKLNRAVCMPIVREGDTTYVECMNQECLALGPEANTQEGAVDKWNKAFDID